MYQDFYIDHYFKSQITKKYSIVIYYQGGSIASIDGVSVGKSGVCQNDSFPVSFMAATKNINEKYETLMRKHRGQVAIFEKALSLLFFNSKGFSRM